NGGFIGKFNDVTERHRAEDELLAAKELAEIANRGKTTFLSHLSHELRTPLNNILAFAEIMKDQLVKDDGGRYREYATYIYESGRVLLQLINDIVDIAKVEAGHVQLHPVPLDIESVIAASSRLLGAEFRSKGIIFSTRVPAESPPLMADEKSLRQIFVNLLSNAAKFTRRGGRIAVSVKPEVSGYYVVEVQDTGVGIPKEDLQKVFMPFDHSDRDLAVRTHGTGLGLPLVKFLMELHGGSVSIDSDVGVGTTVALRFPARGPVRAA
ncbi:MAG: HAMP domain-containing histidine kinase, partial [Rhodospirillales bacterium]|nr:HAMP domain-containing histidine kinase [Rhodospirillales bacterium]